MYEHNCMYIYHNNHCAWWEFCIVSSDIIYPLSYNYKFSQPVFTHKFRITNITMSTKTWLNKSILKQLTSLFTDTNVNYCESTSTSFLKFDPNLCSFYFTNKQCCLLFSALLHIWTVQRCLSEVLWSKIGRGQKPASCCHDILSLKRKEKSEAHIAALLELITLDLLCLQLNLTHVLIMFYVTSHTDAVYTEEYFKIKKKCSFI